MIYLQLFLSFFKIGLFGFGGGYAILSLIQHEIETYGWMSQQEFVDIVAISQMTPGPIGINSATYVGYTASGSILGSVIATSAIILPSVIIMLIICGIYLRLKDNRWVEGSLKALRITVLGLIAAAALVLMTGENFIDGWSVLLFLLVFFGTLLPQFRKKQPATKASSSSTPAEATSSDTPTKASPSDTPAKASSSSTPAESLSPKENAPRRRPLSIISHPIFLIVLAGCLGYLIYGPLHLDRYLQFRTSEEQRIEQQVDSVLNSLSTREKVAQLVMVTATSYGDSAFQARLHRLVAEEGIGGIILAHDSLTRSRAYVNHLQREARIPLLVSIDGEWGPSMRFAEFPFFPRQMQLGALPSDSLVYQMGLAVGRQCREAGIHINFAPVVDINSNPHNLAIGARSFGEDRQRVADYGSAYMRGMQDAGIFACAKHFPGHGDTDVDSHKALPLLPFSRERLDSLELYPFRRLIRDGVSLVMLAHMHIPALDSTVSSISRPIVTDLLKNELGFEGVVITDALVMKGVAEGREAADVMLQAYTAGVDILLMPADPVAGLDRITAFLEDPALSPRARRHALRDLNQRVRKVLTLKARAGLLARNTEATALATASTTATADASTTTAAADASLTTASDAASDAFASFDAAIIDTTGLVARVRHPEDSVLIERIADQSLTLLGAELATLLPDSLADAASSSVAYIGYGADYTPLSRFYGDLEGLSGYGSGSGVLPSQTVCYQRLAEAISPAPSLAEAFSQAPDLAEAPAPSPAATHETSAAPSSIRYYPLSRALSAEELSRQLAAIASRHGSLLLAIHAPSDRPYSELVDNSTHAAVLASFVQQHKPYTLFFGTPYGLNDYPWLALSRALLIGYADTPANERAAADILLGRITPRGELPVAAGPFPIFSPSQKN